MIEAVELVLTGDVVNGRAGNLAMPFFTGPVGVRVRPDAIEVAYFGVAPAGQWPIDGELDGAPVRAIAARSRTIAAGVARRARPDDVVAVTVTLIAR